MVVDVQAVGVDAHEQLAGPGEARLDADGEQRDRVLGSEPGDRVAVALGELEQLGARALRGPLGGAQAGRRGGSPRAQRDRRRAARGAQLGGDLEQLGARGLGLREERLELCAQLVDALAHLAGSRSAARRQTRTGCWARIAAIAALVAPQVAPPAAGSGEAAATRM